MIYKLYINNSNVLISLPSRIQIDKGENLSREIE